MVKIIYKGRDEFSITVFVILSNKIIIRFKNLYIFLILKFQFPTIEWFYSYL